MALIGIVAIAKNFAIGKDGKLPWHYTEDLKFFKNETVGNSIVMGSHTWDSIGKRLPKRINIVLTSQKKFESEPGVIVAHSVDEVCELAKYLSGDVFVIGGAMVYKSFSAQIDKWIVTEVPLTVEDADAFMPEKFLDGFAEVSSEQLSKELIVRYYERV
ncbi:MAG: dihydrofolate reductase [Pyrinomonadaceae bacterium]